MSEFNYKILIKAPKPGPVVAGGGLHCLFVGFASSFSTLPLFLIGPFISSLNGTVWTDKSIHLSHSVSVHCLGFVCVCVCDTASGAVGDVRLPESKNLWKFFQSY